MCLYTTLHVFNWNYEYLWVVHVFKTVIIAIIIYCSLWVIAKLGEFRNLIWRVCVRPAASPAGPRLSWLWWMENCQSEERSSELTRQLPSARQLERRVVLLCTLVGQCWGEVWRGDRQLCGPRCWHWPPSVHSSPSSKYADNFILQSWDNLQLRYFKTTK